MVRVPESAPVLTVDEVESVRSRLRRSDEESRRAALAAIDGWDGRVVSPAAADSLLRAVTLAYPWVRNPRVDPASRLARALCAAPRAVDVHAVEAAYLVSGERVRRLLLHLLALRRDDDGVGSLVFLLGPDGPADLLPLPVAGMLAPVLSAERAADLVPVLVHLAGRTGWVWRGGSARGPGRRRPGERGPAAVDRPGTRSGRGVDRGGVRPGDASRAGAGQGRRPRS